MKFCRTKFKDDIILSLFWDKNQGRRKYRPILWDEIKERWDDVSKFLGQCPALIAIPEYNADISESLGKVYSSLLF